MSEIYVIQNILLVFLLVFGIISVIYYISRKSGPVKAGKEKTKIFACGEDVSPETLNLFGSGFFELMGKILGIEIIRKMHNGDLSNYMTWIFIGMLFIIVVMVIMW